MAIGSGSRLQAPESRWRRLLQWVGFAALLGRFLGVGLLQWVKQRWVVRDPNVG